jgi:glycosyltransferase involved in cell wall biosynthesis
MRVALLTTDSREHYKDYQNPEPYFGTAPEALLEGFKATADAQVHVLSCLQQDVQSPEKIGPNVWYHGLVVPKTGWLRTGYQGCIRAVRKKLREVQPDIVHGQGTERDCAISAVLSGFPNVLTIHGNIRLIAKVNRARPFTFQWLSAQLERFTLPRSDGVVCITNYTRKAVQDLAKRTWVIPNAVDTSFFEVKRNPDPNPTLLCVGHISIRKNQQQLIRALDPLAQQRGFRVLFLGNAAEPDYAAEFLRMVEQRPWCTYGGMADRQPLKEYLRRAALLVLPSLEDNCPMVVLEAMAAGVPVVAADVGGVPDLVQDKLTGLLCDPLDARSIASAIEQMLADSRLAAEVSERARKGALERFHPNQVAARHMAVYRDLLGR